MSASHRSELESRSRRGISKVAACVVVALLVPLAGFSPTAAQGASVWALQKQDRVVTFNRYATITAEHYDKQGGWVEVTVDGRTLDLCPGGWERIRFEWKFPQDITQLPSGGGVGVTLQAGIAGLVPPCNGAIAAISSITLANSRIWPYTPQPRNAVDVDRFYNVGLDHVWANREPKTTIASIRLNTRDLNPDSPWSLFSLQIAVRGGGGDLWYVYFYKGTMGAAQPVDRSLQDMVARARRDGRFGASVAGSAGAQLNWGPGWQLRWVDFQFSGNRRVRVYHITSTTNPAVRYTIYHDPDTGQWRNWEQAT